MSTNSTKAYGSQLYYKGPSDGDWVKIAQTRDLSSPSPEKGDINITNNDSPDNTKEYRPGMVEPGDLEFELIYEKSQQAELLGLMDDDAIYEFAIEYPDGAGWEFVGYVKGFGTEGETEDGVLVTTCTIKVTGMPEFSETLGIS